jgi:hypothetical protein
LKENEESFEIFFKKKKTKNLLKHSFLGKKMKNPLKYSFFEKKSSKLNY